MPADKPEEMLMTNAAPRPSQTHELTLPLTRIDIEAVHAGDMVYISGHITCTIGLPTHKRMVDMLDAGEPLPVDLRGGGFMHLSVYNRELPGGDVALDAPGDDAAARYEALYMNPTTSTRYVSFMPKLVEGYGLRIVGGKGGLDHASVQALQRQGAIYVSYLGGGVPLLSKAIKRVVAVHWTDYISQFRLVTLDVDRLGPNTVAIDAHGVSLYEQLLDQAQGRMAEIMRVLNESRAQGA